MLLNDDVMNIEVWGKDFTDHLRRFYMKLLDEDILRKREEIKKERYKTLEDGFYMDGKVMRFDRKKLLETLSVLLPDTMKEMPKVYARIKYPSEFRPQKIFTTVDLSVNMGFTAFPREIQNKDIRQLSERMKSAIHRANPDYRMYSTACLSEIGGAWFAFRSHAMDSDLYNMMLAVPVGAKLVQCSFNCYYKEYPKWEKVILMMWESIRALEQED